MTYSWGIANFKYCDNISLQLNTKSVCTSSRVEGAESQNRLQKYHCKILQSVSETEHLTR